MSRDGKSGGGPSNTPRWKFKRDQKQHANKKSKDQGRASKTVRSQEAKRFSTVKFPKKAEVKTANLRPLAPELRAGGPSLAEIASRQAIMKKPNQNNNSNLHQDAAAVAEHSNQNNNNAPFDPIPSDPVFFLVENSSYWPPVPLAKLLAKNKNNNNNYSQVGDLNEDDVDAATMDQFDRQRDEKEKRKMAEKMVKQQKKLNTGELFHPRGKAAVNSKVKLDSDSDDE